jgi:putative cell wall-binding protein
VRRLTVLLVIVLVALADPAHAATARRLAGADRYATAAAVALDRWSPRGASDVVVAGGEDPADALAGAYVSGLHSSPVLLTARDALPAVTLDALRAIAPNTVHVLGGTASVGPGVVDALQAEGWSVQRHAGADRYATAAAVARSGGSAIVGSWRSEGRTAVVANGRAPFDALAAGPLVAGQLLPLLLVERDGVPAATGAVLDDLEIAHVIVLGGTGAVSDGVVDALVASGRTVRRVAGVDRTATAVAVADLLGELGLEIEVASLVSGVTPFDALGAGAWGAPRRPVLLCQTPSFCGASTIGWAQSHELDEVVVIGGQAAVSDAAAATVATPM